MKGGMRIMKIMIDISKDSYEATCNGRMSPIDIKNVVEAIKNGKQQPKTAHWIVMSEGFSPYECSECGSVEFKKSKYCPNCGAYMTESEEEEE